LGYLKWPFESISIGKRMMNQWMGWGSLFSNKPTLQLILMISHDFYFGWIHQAPTCHKIIRAVVAIAVVGCRYYYYYYHYYYYDYDYDYYYYYCFLCVSQRLYQQVRYGQKKRRLL